MNVKKAIVFPVLCIPVIAAVIIGTGVFGGKGDVKPSNVLEKIIITSSDGESFEYGSPDALDLYSKTISNSTPVSEPEIGSEAETFTVRFSGTSESPEYYFTMDATTPSNCVYKNMNGEYFSIASDDATNLLLRNEFVSAYSVDGVSDLIFTYGDVSQNVVASTYSWNYRRVDGEFARAVPKTNDESSRSNVRIPNNSSFDISFKRQPDSVIIIAMDGEDVVYNGAPDGFAQALNFNNDKLLNLSVEAKWYENEAASSYGDAVYSFDMLYDVPATYELVDKQLPRGGFTFIKVINGNIEDQITATSDLMEGSTKAFVVDSKIRIYIPVSRNAPVGQNTITVNSNTGSATLKLNVSNRNNFATKNAEFSGEVISLNTQQARDNYKNLLSELSAKSVSSNKLIGDVLFAKPVSGTIVASYGDEIKVTGLAEPIISNGIYYKSTAGAVVKAANTGTVIFAGTTDYTGNAVIIDHGVGIFSYYFNLGSVSCKEGDTVTKGTEIGTVGTSGVTPYTDTVFYANSVDGFFVNAALQFEYEISFG